MCRKTEIERRELMNRRSLGGEIKRGRGLKRKTEVTSYWRRS
jgi:hypothetical protein